MNLRKLARDRDCQVRLPGICNFDTATTVLAHVRMAGLCGIGMKSDDLLACPACFACHNAIDRRSNMDLDRDYVRLAHYEGVLRWLNVLISEGVLAV